MPLRALIFDFDGTIIDTETPEVHTWQKIFRDHGVEFPDAYWMNAIGRGADQIDKTPVDLLHELAGPDVHRFDILVEYERIRMKAIYAAPVRPGVRELIESATAAGIKLAIASSSFHNWVDPLLAQAGLTDHFAIVACANDVAMAKPFPDLYQFACLELGVSPSEAVAIEDSPNGIRAAKAAGLACVAIPNPCTVQMNLSEADFQAESASDLTIEHLSSFLKDVPAIREQRIAANPRDTSIQESFEAIVAEMKRTGIWEVPRPPDAAFEYMGAFGLDTMALEQWLRWVFAPTVESKLKSDGPWPQSSNVGTVALRNFDGRHEYADLVSLLCQFDSHF